MASIADSIIRRLRSTAARELGPVSHYDYVGDGYRVEDFWTRSR